MCGCSSGILENLCERHDLLFDEKEDQKDRRVKSPVDAGAARVGEQLLDRLVQRMLFRRQERGVLFSNQALNFEKEEDPKSGPHMRRDVQFLPR